MAYVTPRDVLHRSNILLTSARDIQGSALSVVPSVTAAAEYLMFYQLYEMNHAALQPARLYADAVRLFYSNPLNPVSHTPWGRSIAAGAELFERPTRRYGKPQFGLAKTVVDWTSVAVT